MTDYKKVTQDTIQQLRSSQDWFDFCNDGMFYHIKNWADKNGFEYAELERELMNDCFSKSSAQ